MTESSTAAEGGETALRGATNQPSLPRAKVARHQGGREPAAIGGVAKRSDSTSGLEVPPGPRRAIPPKLQNQLALCASFPDRILFLDIETTGLSHYYDEITIVGWTFGGTAKTLVKGQDPSPLVKDAARAKALVTFNGIRFDTKFIAKEFPEVTLPDTHLDLMYLCRRLGLKGGQKAIEKELNIRLPRRSRRCRWGRRRRTLAPVHARRYRCFAEADSLQPSGYRRHGRDPGPDRPAALPFIPTCFWRTRLFGTGRLPRVGGICPARCPVP